METEVDDCNSAVFVATTEISAILEGLAVVVMNIQVTWDVTPCRSVNIYRRFGLSLCFHMHVQWPA